LIAVAKHSGAAGKHPFGRGRFSGDGNLKLSPKPNVFIARGNSAGFRGREIMPADENPAPSTQPTTGKQDGK
jgi:hypothetical protein